MDDTKSIYSDRVDWYVKGRPVYPLALINLLSEPIGIPTSATVADVGSGTALFSGLLLSYGVQVYAIEPNSQMRCEAERVYGTHPRFYSIAGSAEQTMLPDASVDAITVAQALHWFNLQESRREFNRILRGEKRMVFLWNERSRTASRFLVELDQVLLELLPDYKQSLNCGTPKTLTQAFLGHENFNVIVLNHSQLLDAEGLLGRVFSSSYSPAPTHPVFTEIALRLRTLHNQYQCNGLVQIQYDTTILYATL